MSRSHKLASRRRGLSSVETNEQPNQNAPEHSDPETDPESSPEVLNIPSTQTPAPTIAENGNQAILKALEHINCDTFFSDTDVLAQLGENPSPILSKALRSHLDPASSDFLIYMRGRNALMDFYKAKHHHTNLCKLRDSNRIPQSLQVPKRVNVYKPRPETALKIKSIQSQYESLLLNTLIQHHDTTIGAGKQYFRSAWSQLRTATNANIVKLKWTTIHKTSNTDLDANRTRNQKRPNPNTPPTRRPNPNPAQQDP